MDEEEKQLASLGAVSMQAYVDQQFASLLREIQQTNEQWEKRFHALELTQEQFYAQASHTITRDEHDKLLARVSTVEKIAADISGRFWAFGIGLSILTIVVSVLVHFI